MKFIIICAIGRSGSTTLQRIINTIPNSNITGEKKGAIASLLDCYRKIKILNEVTPKKIFSFEDKILNKMDYFDWEKYINFYPDLKNNGINNKQKAIKHYLNYGKKAKRIFFIKKKITFINDIEYEKRNIKPCFYNSYDFDEVKENIKNTIISILKKNDKTKLRVLGYKEVRFVKRLNLLNEFLELFPNTKIILHTDDNIERISKSSFWNDNKDAKNIILKYNQEMKEYASNKNFCYFSYMKNLFNIDEVKKMFLFLDEKLNENKYNKIVNNNLG